MAQLAPLAFQAEETLGVKGLWKVGTESTGELRGSELAVNAKDLYLYSKNDKRSQFLFRSVICSNF